MTKPTEKKVIQPIDETKETPTTDASDAELLASANHLKQVDQRHVSGEQPAATRHLTPTPGELLKNARERARLTTEQVAQHLKLKTDYVVSLEKNQYDSQIFAPVFIKGHLRSLAKYLTIDPDYLVQSYTTHTTDNRPPALINTTEPKAPPRWRKLSLAWIVPRRVHQLLETWHTYGQTYKHFMRTALALCVLLIGGLVYGMWHRTPQAASPASPSAHKSSADNTSTPVQNFELIPNQKET